MCTDDLKDTQDLGIMVFFGRQKDTVFFSGV